MSATINTAALEAKGMCGTWLSGLRGAFGETVTIGEDIQSFLALPEQRMTFFWALRLLSLQAQKELLLSWFDRALNGASPSWENDLLSYVNIPTDAESIGTFAMSRLSERESLQGNDAWIAGCASSLAFVAKAYAEGHGASSESVGKRCMVFVQYVVNTIAAQESKEVDAVRVELVSDWIAKANAGGLAA